MGKKFNWIVGENLGNTMNNNSWHYYLHTVDRGSSDNINIFFIATKNKENKKKAKSLKGLSRKNIVWRNSLKHHLLYLISDVQIVTLSYKDVLPDIYKDLQFRIRPTVYLQHGTAALKKIGYTRDSYLNSIFKFVTYSENESKLLVKENNFSEHQVKNIKAHPRYKELVRINREYQLSKPKYEFKILWFLTWREYLLDNVPGADRHFTDNIKKVLEDETLQDYLRKTGANIKIVLHQFFNQNILDQINEYDNVQAVHADETDVMQDIAKSDLLITDYSSLGFDFTFLKKPVVMYQFDSFIYSIGRDFYIDINNDLEGLRVRKPDELVDVLVNEKYGINKFFADRIPEDIDMDYIERGGHIDELHNYLVWSQSNKISIIGYNFYGKGGTVSASISLAEGLLEKGYMVELISLKQINTKTEFPGGLILRSFMKPWRSVVESIKYRLFLPSYLLGYLNQDINRAALIPYVGYALRRFLNKTKSRTVISTRESIHLFVDEAVNPNIVNRLYFFHNSAKTIEQNYPGVLDEVKSRPSISKALFVSESSRIEYADLMNYNHYTEHAITGNALYSGSIIPKGEIQSVKRKKIYRGLVLMRLSADRVNSIHNLIDFCVYLKNNNINNIHIDVFGEGDGLYELGQGIDDNGLNSIVSYMGKTSEPQIEIREHDFLVDFSEEHTFGMIYIEAILNGRVCFSKSNAGSREVLRGIDGYIYNNWDDLVEKIQSLHLIPKSTLVDNYNTISSRYSRENVVDSVESLMD